MGSITGAALAGAALALLTEALRSVAEYRMVAYSLLLILVMILRPQGLLGTQEAWTLIRGMRARRAQTKAKAA
jgi:branched-chain amino acid transport system permease protein